MTISTGKDIHDVIVVGGGPAGCSAAIVLARSQRTVMIIDEGRQRNLSSHGMHNFLTRDGILPSEYLSLAHRELAHYKVKTLSARVASVKMLGAHGFEVVDAEGNIYLCRRLLLATGVTDNVPDIPGMRELWGNGVYHCPYCDGWECRQAVIGLYAPLDGYGMALALRQLSEHVILFTQGGKYLRPKQRNVLAARNIAVDTTPLTQLVQKDNKLTGIMLQDGREIKLDALFVNNGHKVNDELLEQLNCNRTKKGAAITNKQQCTSVPGVYVAGDASFDMHFVIVAAAEGAKAAVAINCDLLDTDNN